MQFKSHNTQKTYGSYPPPTSIRHHGSFDFLTNIASPINIIPNNFIMLFSSMNPRHGRKNWVSAHQRALFQKFCPISKFCPTSNFCHMDRLEDLTPPNWSYNLFLGQGAFLLNSVMWGPRFSQLKGAKRINHLFAWKMRFPLHPYYSSR